MLGVRFLSFLVALFSLCRFRLLCCLLVAVVCVLCLILLLGLVFECFFV
jgi:hypothetical protein